MPTNVQVQFNPIFREMNTCRDRYRVFYGSAGSGKSVNIAQDYICKLGDPRYAGNNLMVIRKVDESNRFSTYAELSKAVYKIFGDKADRYWKITKTPLMMRNLKTKNEIIFEGMADERQREKIKSVTFSHGKLTWIWCEEATELRVEDVDILDDRLRGELEGPNQYYQMTFSFNPVSASHWIKGRFFDVKSPMVRISKSTYLDNRFCDAQYHQRMMERKERDPEGYRVYGLGEWGELGGLILTNFVVDSDFKVTPYSFDAMALGQDFGFNHANCILLLGIRDGEIYVCQELYVHETTLKDIQIMAEAQKFPKHLRMYCDSARPDDIEAWKLAHWRAWPADKGPGSVLAQIRWLKDRKIHIHPSCVNFVKEIQAWKWIKDPKTGLYIDEPVEIFDDAMAALRYGVQGWREKSRYDKREGQSN
jgi:phage terminase large subunit